MIARQRGFAVTLIVYAVAILAICAAVYGVWWKADHWQNAAYREAIERAEKAEKRAEVAEAAVEAEKAAKVRLAGLYGEQVAATQAAESQRDKERNARFQPVQERARTLSPYVASVRIPAAAVGVLNDAIRAAAGPPAEPGQDPAPAASVGQVTEWGVEMVGLYSECRDQVLAFQDFYRGLQRGQDQSQAP